MNKILIALIISLLAALTIIWQYTTNQKLTTNLAVTQRALSEKKAIINNLSQQKNKLTASQQALTKTLQTNKAELIHQLKTLQELKDENQTYRDWASNLLPPTIARLQQRPTITSSEHYRKHLRHRKPLSAKPSNPENQ